MIALHDTDLPTRETWRDDVDVHPAADMFPLLDGAKFDELVTGIREDGLVHPIVRTSAGQIVDGRNRYRACLAAEVAPRFETTDAEPWRYVISTNLHRRQLTDAERAMIAARMAERTHGGYRHGVKSSDEDLTQLPPSRNEVRQLLNVSSGSLDRAKAVVNHGTPSLVDAVDSGTVTISAGARAAKLAPAEQDAYVGAVRNGTDPQRAVDAVRAPGSNVSPINRGPGTPPHPAAAPPDVPTGRKGVRRSKYRFVEPHVVPRFLDQLDALRMVIESAQGELDPTVTAEQAAAWTRALTDGMRHARQLQAIVKERSS